MNFDDYKLELVSSNIAPWEPKNDPSRQIVVMMSGMEKLKVPGVFVTI